MTGKLLDCVRPVSLDIWRVERRVCAWTSCLGEPSSLSTAVTFSSVHACFGLPFSCLWSMLPVSGMFSSKVSSPLLLQFIFENSSGVFREPYTLNWYKFLINAVCSTLNDMFHCRYSITTLKLLFTIISSAFAYCTDTSNVF